MTRRQLTRRHEARYAAWVARTTCRCGRRKPSAESRCRECRRIQAMAPGWLRDVPSVERVLTRPGPGR